MAGRSVRAMKLYSSAASPFARKVRVLILETGQEGDVEIIDTLGTPTDTGTHPVALNPVSKIPVLERADGPAIYDSRVISRFLDARAGGVLYPEAPRLWDTLTLEATGDAIMDAAILMVYEWRVRPEEKRFPDWVDAQWSKIERALGHLEARWMSHLHGKLDMGLVSVGCALEYLDFRHGDRDWRAGHDALAAWQKGFGGRASMEATVPALPKG